ncbi:redoxin domain-containing protein [Granulicella sp. 5B5]|uniref:thioredoxin family protein n=1 Tax=Granulicella sp. 5B5 TaxID=1617967 RepID=UPI0015F6B6EE|nr:thioredoxin family protein [Granulicella sp. 5B5]QMV19190.1 redoxin domain-containing protein [Granulicella sp. 5B5]
MSRTESMMVELGTVAPAFELTDVVMGKAVGRDDAAQGMKGLLVMFVCPHCPYVKYVEAELGKIGRDYSGKIGVVAINSNDLGEYPQDGPEFMREQAEKNGWPFPYLLDETQEIARAYEAACTPDFFLFGRSPNDEELRLVYRGQLDESRPRRGDFGNDVPVTGKDLRAAMDAVVAGEKPSAEQKNSIGCNIKYRQ